MPNGYDKNWLRVCAAIDGFRARHGRWPTRVRAFRSSLYDFYLLFTLEDRIKIASKITLVADDVPMIAEDDSGAEYNYGQEGFPQFPPDFRAADWLGVSPLHEMPSTLNACEDSEGNTRQVLIGVIRGWDDSGLGVIVPDDGSPDVTVFEGEVSDSSDFKPGQRVNFEVEINRATQEPMAVRVSRVPPSC
jgi:cold shock CspA family protein